MAFPSALPSLAAALFALSALPSAVMAQQDNDPSSASTSTVVSSLILNGVIFGVEILVFFILRPRFPRIYQPKSVLGPRNERTQPLPKSLFGWIPQYLKTPTTEIISNQGIDAFQFVDYLEMMIWIFVPIWGFTWVFLMPLYSVQSTGGKSGFDMFTFGNVGLPRREQLRYIGVLFAQWIATFWILYNIRKRLSLFVQRRQQWLVSPKYSQSAQAKTILITGVPNDYLSERRLEKMYGQLPGGVAKIWLNRNLKDLPDLVQDRSKALNKLESAEAKLVKLALKKVRKGKVQAGGEEHATDSEMTVEAADKYVTRKERPSHKLGALGCFGEKVDTIEWAREEIARLNKQISDQRENLTDFERFPPQNSAFILFNRQIAAAMALKAHAHHQPYRMASHYGSAHPGDIVWPNLNMNPYEQKIRTAIFWAATLGLVIFWIIPVGFVGIVSNLTGLCSRVSWLAWMCRIEPASGIIQGILPTVFLAVLNMLLPIVLRLFARLSGGVGEIVAALSNPQGLPTLLAQYIPGASIFFLSYIALQGLTGAASGFMQIVPLAIFYVKAFLLNSTPRSVWHIQNDMGSPAMGTTFPVTSLLSVIAIGYMVIAPITAGFASVSFILFFLLYKYLYLYVYDVKPEKETGGLFFPKACAQLFYALYLEMVILTVLFFVAQDDQGNQSAIPQGAFMIVLIILVAMFHYTLFNSFGDLFTAFPLSLAPSEQEEKAAILDDAATRHDSNSSPGEKQKTQAHAAGGSTAIDIDGPNSKTNLVEDEDAEEDPMLAFQHPATKDPQRTLWFPNDNLGLGSAAVTGAQRHGLEATNRNNEVNEKGRITTDARVPPGEMLN
ncbi:Uncharacterized conserved protein [Ceraceosorus bombacis]|uniref:Uncharacterized conserved protein n=1 Tax=Ceraceosorus bombacis TaxID=401625 RepID=A0A0P1BD17_9BASI|nr:Uncharacterized conserved protein [Ceraceosorus bombacis]